MKKINVVAVLIWLWFLPSCGSNQHTGAKEEAHARSKESTVASLPDDVPERVQLPEGAPPNEILKLDAYAQQYTHGQCGDAGPCLVLDFFLPSLVCSQAEVGDLLNRHIRQYPVECLSAKLRYQNKDITALLPVLYDSLSAKGNAPPIEIYVGAEVTYTSRSVLCIGYSVWDGVHYLMLDMQDGHRLERDEWLVKDKTEELRQLLAAELRKMYNLSNTEPLSKAGFNFEGSLPPLPAQMGYASITEPAGQVEYLVAFYSYGDGATERTGTPEVKIPFSKLKGILKMM